MLQAPRLEGAPRILILLVKKEKKERREKKEGEEKTENCPEKNIIKAISKGKMEFILSFLVNLHWIIDKDNLYTI